MVHDINMFQNKISQIALMEINVWILILKHDQLISVFRNEQRGYLPEHSSTCLVQNLPGIEFIDYSLSNLVFQICSPDLSISHTNARKINKYWLKLTGLTTYVTDKKSISTLGDCFLPPRVLIDFFSKQRRCSQYLDG